MRTVLVTGASRGLGRAIALEFAASGDRVALNYRRNRVEAEAVATAAEDMPGEAAIFRADVSSAGDVDAMFDAIGRRFGSIDVLVNNAGIAADGLIARADDDTWRRVMAVNLGGAALCSRRAAAMMAGGGSIINISSLSGMIGRSGQAAYATAKAGLVGLTKSLAAELGPAGIRVNAVLPGYLATDMGRASGEAMRRAESESVLGALGDVDEAAKFVVHLARMTRVSGQVLCIGSRLWGQP